MLVFPLRVAGSETAQGSPPALRGLLSEELGMARSDLGIKLHFNLQNSCTNSRCSSKGASDTGAKPSHGGKKDLLHLQQTAPELLPSDSCQTQGAEVSCRNSLHEVQQFELGKWFGVLPSPFSCFKRMELDCCSYKASSVPGLPLKDSDTEAALFGAQPIFCLVWGFLNIPFKTRNVLWKILDFRKSLWPCHRVISLYTTSMTCSWLQAIQHTNGNRDSSQTFAPKNKTLKQKTFLKPLAANDPFQAIKDWNFWDASLLPTGITLLKCFRYM